MSWMVILDLIHGIALAPDSIICKYKIFAHEFTLLRYQIIYMYL